MREREIEAYFCKRVKEAGGLQRKFVSPGHRGVPDRIVIYNGRILFAELKRPGSVAEDHQKREHDKFREQGIPVYVIDSLEGVDNLIEKLRGWR